MNSVLFFKDRQLGKGVGALTGRLKSRIDSRIGQDFRANLVTRNQRKGQDQLVFHEYKGIEIAAEYQHIFFRLLVHAFRSAFVGHENKGPLGGDRRHHRVQATLTLHREIHFGREAHANPRFTSRHRDHLASQSPAHLQILIRGTGHLFVQQAGPLRQRRLPPQLGARLRKGLDVQATGIEGFFHGPSVRESLSMTTLAPALTRTVVLGSTSRYRRELLSRLNLPFEVAAPEVDETPLAGETPRDLALRLALAKARAVATRHPEAVVIGSDQVADLAGTPLGKPGNHARAVEQLRQMRGQTVVFQTALAVVCLATGFEQVDLAPVRVQFRALTDAEIENYLQAEKPYDCAGSAKSEGLGIALLDSIENDDPTALVGLPLIRTARMLRAAGVPLL